MEGLGILIFLAALLLFALVILFKTVRIVPQQTSLIIERLGRYSRTLEGGIHILIPFVDKVRANIDLREQVVSFPPQPVITSDNLVVNIDTVIYYTVIDAKSAVYEIANFIQGIEQLTVTTLRNVIGSLDLEQTLTSRDQINAQLRGALDEATGRWGIRVNRVELKAIDPPFSIQESMEKQMKAERDRRAAILNAEGTKQSAILTAEGEKQSQILRAEGSAQARILEAQGQARAIQQVFDAIHRASRRRSCSPTSTSRCCRRSPAATATRCGSSPPSSPTRSRRWAACSARAKGDPTAPTRRAGSSRTPRRRTPSPRPRSRTRPRRSRRPAVRPGRPAVRRASTRRRPVGCSRRRRPPRRSRTSPRPRRRPPTGPRPRPHRRARSASRNT